MKTTIITKEEVSAVLAAVPNGQFFSVLFDKKDGEERLMNGRRGVKKYLAPADPNKAKRAAGPVNVIKMFDRQILAYRSFCTDSVKRISALGQQFVVA